MDLDIKTHIHLNSISKEMEIDGELNSDVPSLNLWNQKLIEIKENISNFM